MACRKLLIKQRHYHLNRSPCYPRGSPMASAPTFKCGAPKCRAPSFGSKNNFENHIIREHGAQTITALRGLVEVSRDPNDLKYYCQCNESVWTKAEFHNHVRRNCSKYSSRTKSDRTYPPNKSRKTKSEGGHQVSAVVIPPY